MRLLLDTHVLIWWDDGASLAAKAAEAIREADRVYVSAVTAWEIAIKAALGRLETRRSVTQAVVESGFEELPIRFSHTEHLEHLPLHHRDPFDRLLISQAVSERLTLVTRNRIFSRYEVRTLHA